jgi:DNA mismatch endonuclease Vsr
MPTKKRESPGLTCGKRYRFLRQVDLAATRRAARRDQSWSVAELRLESRDLASWRFARRLRHAMPCGEIPTDAMRSSLMGRVRQHGTKLELAARTALRRMGLSYRVANRGLPGSPDIANRSKGWAIFVHGCFWHRHPGCSRATTPHRNAQFWKKSLRPMYDATVWRSDNCGQSGLRSSWYGNARPWNQHGSSTICGIA